MANVMVTGRMTKAKKDAGNKVLESLGTNASQAINQLYDYLVEEHRLPFDDEVKSRPSVAQIKGAIAFIEDVPIANAFSSMSDEDIKAKKLESLLKA